MKLKFALLIALCMVVLALTIHHAHARRRIEGCGIIHFGPDVIDQTPPDENHCPQR